MKCLYCGAENREDYVYCLNCGKPLRKKEKASARSLNVRLDKKVIIAAAAVLAIAVLAILFWPKGGSRLAIHSLESRLFVVSRDSGNYAVAAGNKTSGPFEGRTSSLTYSFDRSCLAFILANGDERLLYLYNGKALKPYGESVDYFVLADSGEFACYQRRDDDSWHYVNLKNNKTVLRITGENEAVKYLKMSVSGKTVAYVLSGSESTLHLITGNKTAAYDLGETTVAHLVAVGPDDSVLLLDVSGQLLHFRKGNLTSLASSPSSIFINDDASECAFMEEGKYAIFRDGRLQTSDSEYAEKIAALIYPETMATANSRVYVNHQYVYCYHHGLSSFISSYYLTTDNKIIRFDRKLNAEVIAEDVDEVLLSNSGKKLVYTDSFGTIFVYDGKKTDELATGDYDAETLLAYDEVHDGVYYRSVSDNQIVYADRKTCLPFFNKGTYTAICCDDGYFYFKNSYTLYYSLKGAEPVEIDRCFSSSKATNDDYSRHGILYYGTDKNYYFLTKGTKVLIPVEP